MLVRSSSVEGADEEQNSEVLDLAPSLSAAFAVDADSACQMQDGEQLLDVLRRGDARKRRGQGFTVDSGTLRTSHVTN